MCHHYVWMNDDDGHGPVSVWQCEWEHLKHDNTWYNGPMPLTCTSNENNHYHYHISQQFLPILSTTGFSHNHPNYSKDKVETTSVTVERCCWRHWSSCSLDSCLTHLSSWSCCFWASPNSRSFDANLPQSHTMQSNRNNGNNTVNDHETANATKLHYMSIQYALSVK